MGTYEKAIILWVFFNLFFHQIQIYNLCKRKNPYFHLVIFRCCALEFYHFWQIQNETNSIWTKFTFMKFSSWKLYIKIDIKMEICQTKSCLSVRLVAPQVYSVSISITNIWICANALNVWFLLVVIQSIPAIQIKSLARGEFLEEFLPFVVFSQMHQNNISDSMLCFFFSSFSFHFIWIFFHL